MKHLVDELDVCLCTPGERKPILAGRLTDDAGVVSFVYDPDFLRLPNAMPIFERDLPLGTDRQYPVAPHKLGVLNRHGRQLDA